MDILKFGQLPQCWYGNQCYINSVSEQNNWAKKRHTDTTRRSHIPYSLPDSSQLLSITLSLIMAVIID